MLNRTTRQRAYTVCMRTWKIIGLFVFVLVVAGGVYIFTHSGKNIDLDHPPQFIQADFVDLSKITTISKFRSGEGHDFSGGRETCRSMKHYFRPNTNPNTWTKNANGQYLPPEPDGKTDIPIYSPVDGKIRSISDEQTPIGKQISIIPSEANQFNIRLFHIYPLAGIESGSKVKAGQQIGVIGANSGTDIAVQVGQFPWNEVFVSYFAVMQESIFAAYQARGITSREDVIISRAERDANPLQCDGEKFLWPADYDREADDIHLSGYIAPNYGNRSN